MKKYMFTLAAAALLALVGSGCATGPRVTQPAAAPTMLTQTVTDRRGNITETVTDNRGKAAAAEGQALATTEQVWRDATSKLTGENWTLAETVYSVRDMPNKIVIDQLKEKHKSILAEATKLAEAGATKDYEAAIKEAGEIASEIAVRIANMNKGQEDDGGDRASIINRTLSVGTDHTKVPLKQAEEFGSAVRSRHANPNTISTTNTVETEDTSTTEEIKAALESKNIIAAHAARIEELRLLAEQSKREGKPVDEVITDTPDAPDKPGADKPASTTPYDQLSKKNYIYKTRLAANNPVTRHDAAFLIPKDRPAVKSLYIQGLTVVENYFSKSEDRWILRLKGDLPNIPSSAVATYVDGIMETFPITSLAGRTDKPAGPYKYAKPVEPPPVDPVDPVTPKPEVPAGQGESKAP